jgi:hypothetical protein
LGCGLLADGLIRAQEGHREHDADADESTNTGERGGFIESSLEVGHKYCTLSSGKTSVKRIELAVHDCASSSVF